MYKFADFHCDSLLNIYLHEMDLTKLNESGHLDLPRLRQANFVFQCFAVFCDPKFGQEAALRQTLRLIDTAHREIFNQPEVTLIRQAQDLDQAEELAALLSIEGADFLGDDLFLLDLVHSLGVRLITLTWNGRNSIADGVKVGGSGGLTRLGVEAVKRMQDLNIIVDVAHLSEHGFWDVCKVADRPFVASHSNAWQVCNHPRNLKDEQIKEISSRGGLIGMNLCRPFVAEEKEQQNLDMVVNHIRYIADLVGSDVLCLGCDLDGIKAMPEGMRDVRDVAGITDLLAEAGFSPAEIRGICSDNLLGFVKNYLG